jgi:signal transduction histidine kinase/CheY-like chemotaxis protein
MNNNENINQLFYSIFNDTYRSYLNNVPHMIYMHNMLELIIKATQSNSGYIASIDKIYHTEYINIDSYCQEKLMTRDDITFPYNTSFNIINPDAIYSRAIHAKNIIVTKVMSQTDIEHDPIKGLSTNISTYICVPLIFNKKITGILGLSNNNNNDNVDNILSLELLGSLLGVLQNNCVHPKYFHAQNENKYITYQLMEEILDSSASGTFVTDKKFNILYLNEHNKTLLNVLYDKLFDHAYIGKNLLLIFPQLGVLDVDTQCDKIYKNKKVEITISDKKVDTNIYFLINTVMCNRQFYNIVSVNDVKTTSNELNNTNYLLGYLSHELRNPMQNITLATYMLKLNKEKDDNKINNFFIESNSDTNELTTLLELKKDKNMEYIKIIEKGCNNMKRVVDDIMDLSRIDANEFVLEMETCDVSDVLNEIMLEHEQEADSKNLELVLNYGERVPKSLYTDSVRLTQILSNLLSNAIKYSKSGKVIINVAYDPLQKGMLFNVVDTGMGIKQEEMCRIFKHFGKTSNSAKIGNKSCGLGLHISQRIARMLGGNIVAKSEYGNGSTFTLFHPIELGKSYCGQKNKDNYDDTQLIGRILLVEDDIAIINLFRLLLENFNCEYKGNLIIEHVDNGHDAIKLCEINHYNIVFMDINMDGIDGCTTTKIIRTMPFTGKIIAVTGNILAHGLNRSPVHIDINTIDGSNDSNESNEPCNTSKSGTNNYAQFDDVIMKPFTDATMLNVLKKFLSNK